MTLILCPDCDKEISDKSLFCVHCGCPSAYYDMRRKVSKKGPEAVKADLPVRKFDEDGLYLPVMKTIKQASEMTGLSYDNIRNLTLRNEIVYVNAGNKKYINMDSLACYLSGDKYQMESIKKLYDATDANAEDVKKE